MSALEDIADALRDLENKVDADLAEIEDLLETLDLQLEVIVERASAHHIQPRYMQSTDGTYMLVPLIVAKSQLLLAREIHAACNSED